MYRHGRKDEVSELTISDFRRMLLVSLGKLNNKDTLKQGYDELASLAERLNPEDESLSIFMVRCCNILEIHACIRILFWKIQTNKLLHTKRKLLELLL